MMDGLLVTNKIGKNEFDASAFNRDTCYLKAAEALKSSSGRNLAELSSRHAILTIAVNQQF